MGKSPNHDHSMHLAQNRAAHTHTNTHTLDAYGTEKSRFSNVLMVQQSFKAV